MQIRFLLGPAGAGKTFRCLAEIREALKIAPEGRPLILLAPKQTTYALERQLLEDSAIPGYTRLHILSIERLAHFVLDRIGMAPPNLLDEEGRLMVLRGLLSKNRDSLQLFRASARLTGFAQQLSLALRELQRHQLTPEALFDLSARVKQTEGLSLKLHDLGTLLRDYLAWLRAHDLQDAECLLSAAVAALAHGEGRGVETSTSGSLGPEQTLASKNRKARGKIPLSNAADPSQLSFALFPSGGNPAEQSEGAAGLTGINLGELWVDGFAEFSPQEIAFLKAVSPHCDRATLTFCLEQAPAQKYSWLSPWSVPQACFEDCKKALEDLPGSDLVVEVLKRQPAEARFAKSPVLQHLEQNWSNPESFHDDKKVSANAASLRIARCANPEAEALTAAREILAHIRAGGRFREVAVLVRTLEPYHEVIARIFSRYEIPFFLDRRESVAHHPLAELTRNAIRTIAFQWQSDDWFAALKSGLVPAEDEEIDRLENESLSRGWKGKIWENPIVVKDQALLNQWLASVQSRLMPPFQNLSRALGGANGKTKGPELASALRQFWNELNVETQLESWSSRESPANEFQNPSSVHATVWAQMNQWLINVELAFSEESLRLREWLPILEAGLGGMTVGLIPPALDQVLIGAIDRSRNPDIRLAIILGLNETVFPASPQIGSLLTETDREELCRQQVVLASGTRQELGRERFYGYVGCTRARERLLLTSAITDGTGRPLNPSPFLSQIMRLFPTLEIETPAALPDWREAQHANELIAPILKMRGHGLKERSGNDPYPAALQPLIEKLERVQEAPTDERLSPELAAKLYGPVLRTSVSRIEQFAACPFRFFVNSGLRAEERKQYELDVREQGSFQHDVLADFHNQLRAEGKRWRDVSPTEARKRIERIGQAQLEKYKDGLLLATEESRFLGHGLIQSLQDFVEVLVGWMHEQYLFDPVAVELPFGTEPDAPAWEIQIDQERRLALHGRIDRVDLFKIAEVDAAMCVVLDYKSSQKQLDPLLLENGLQLQLLAYLNVLRQWPNPKEKFGVSRLIPSGVFYVNLRGRYDRELTRTDALQNLEAAKKQACAHTGRFDVTALPKLDSRPDELRGDQFNYRRRGSGELRSGSREALPAEEFEALLDSVEAHLVNMGKAIFEGRAGISPFRKGTVTACDHCQYESICRIDPWTQTYRVLRKQEKEGA